MLGVDVKFPCIRSIVDIKILKNNPDGLFAPRWPVHLKIGESENGIA